MAANLRRSTSANLRQPERHRRPINVGVAAALSRRRRLAGRAPVLLQVVGAGAPGRATRGEQIVALDATRSDLRVGIVGGGAMGRGIAQVAIAGGIATLIHDSAPGVTEAARDFIARMLRRQAEKGAMSGNDVEAALARLGIAAHLDDLAACDVVVEAVVEDLEAKRTLFRELERIVGAEAVLASNTSSLRIAAIAAACEHRRRVAGMHFFNPVPLMKLVEIVRAPDTDPAVVEQLAVLGRRMGRTAVEVADGPGFLVNLGGRAFVTEGLRIAQERIAPPSAVDAVMRDAWGFRMGPFELMDLTGIDVNFPATMAIYDGYFQERRIATSPLHESLHASGRFGRKAGAGYYAYDKGGSKIAESPDAPTDADPAPRVCLAEPDDALAALADAAGAEIVGDGGTEPILAAPLGEDCTALAVRAGIDHRRLVAVDLTGDLTKRLTVMTAPGADAAVRAQVVARLANTGAPVTAIADSPGFIGQRIAAMVANLGCEMAQLGIARPDDIDTAMKLGLNYPLGPLELGQSMGPARVLAILERLQAITGDDRYRPSQWLRRRAMLGLPISVPG